MTIQDSIEEIRARERLPDPARYSELLETAISFLEAESPGMRPGDASGLSGGLVRLKGEIPTLILPDLHGRRDFFSRAMNASLSGEGTVLEQMRANTIQVLCLGDGIHTECGTRARWLDAFTEYRSLFKKHGSMDSEMVENLSLMEMVLRCKTAFPENFHFLKGNHENILNEEGNGNHAFMKIAYEGDMVRAWTEKFYGQAFLELYARFERSLPLFAIGNGFLASHAEPDEPYAEDDIINARLRPEVILGLTWTNNGEAAEGSVRIMLERFLGSAEGTVYFGGHRPVAGRYALRADGRYVQMHNPQKRIIALSVPGKPFDPETDIREMEEGEICG